MKRATLQDFASEAQAVAWCEALWDVVLRFFAGRSIYQVSYHHYAPEGATRDDSVQFAAAGFPKDWVCHYLDDNLELIDPIPEIALRSSAPFFWTDAPRMARLIPEQSAYLKDLFASGVGEGIGVPVFGPHMRNGYFGIGFSGERRAVSEEELREYQAACQIAHLRYCDLTVATQPGDLPLSMREREILNWVARGKSNSVIADILGLSGNTIDTYLRRIFAKLGVADRTSAAIRGLGSGLIHTRNDLSRSVIDPRV